MNLLTLIAQAQEFFGKKKPLIVNSSIFKKKKIEPEKVYFVKTEGGGLVFIETEVEGEVRSKPL
jgi:hypothetical protein